MIANRLFPLLVWRITFFCFSDGDESNTAAITGDRYCTSYEEPGKQLLILYGTEYGFSEELAKNLFDRFCDNGYQELSLQPRVLNAKAFEMVDFSREQVLLCVFSTSGDGKPRPSLWHYSTKLYRKISQVCCHLYFYEWAAWSSNNANSNKQVIFFLL